MSFAKPAVPTFQDTESLKSQAFEEITRLSPSLAEVLKVKYVPHPQSLDKPTAVLEELEKCRTVEGAITVCSGLYVDAAISVMDTMPYWEQAGRPTKEQTTDTTQNSKYGAGPAEYYKSTQQLGLLNRAMNEIRAGINKDTVLHFEALIRLNDAVLWKELLEMNQKLPKTAQFLRERLPMVIGTYDSISKSSPRTHTGSCQAELGYQERKIHILEKPSEFINDHLVKAAEDSAKLHLEIIKHKEIENQPQYKNAGGREIWELKLQRLEGRFKTVQELYSAAKVASDELLKANGRSFARNIPRALSS